MILISIVLKNLLFTKQARKLYWSTYRFKYATSHARISSWNQSTARHKSVKPSGKKHCHRSTLISNQQLIIKIVKQCEMSWHRMVWHIIKGHAVYSEAHGSALWATPTYPSVYYLLSDTSMADSEFNSKEPG